MKHQNMLTGSIWKCLIFWWWHNVRTYALGLLWLTLSRNNLHSRRREINLCEKQSKYIQKMFERENNFGSLTHPPVPAGGCGDGIPLWLFCRRTTAELCEWLWKRQNVDLNKPPDAKRFRMVQHPVQECLEVPELSDEWCKGLWDPSKFTLVLFWKRSHRDGTMFTPRAEVCLSHKF